MASLVIVVFSAALVLPCGTTDRQNHRERERESDAGKRVTCTTVVGVNNDGDVVVVCGWSQSIEVEQRSREEAREQHQASERRAMVLAGEIEELRAQVEAAERARKIAESELHEASDRVSELSASSSSFSAQKRKLENDIQAMHVSRRFLLVAYVLGHSCVFYCMCIIYTHAINV